MAQEEEKKKKKKKFCTIVEVEAKKAEEGIS